MNNLIKEKLALLPDQPGCYLMKDAQGQIIYVGKAKVLKNRVRSYFTGSHDTKTTKLVSEINDFEYIITESNTEALVLEINLIQKNQPKYNILLKDDKSYPYIKITNERYPRLLITRKILKDKATYFGPYPDVRAANETKKILDRIYPLRKCQVLPKKVCLYYHMGQCLAPCVYDVDREVYQTMVAGIRHFINGGYQDVQKEIQVKMERAAESYEFEQAAEYRDQIAAISSLMTRQKMTNVDMRNRDVFGYSVDKGWMCVQVFYVRQGKMIKRDATSFPIYNEPDEDFLTYIGSFYTGKEQLVPQEVLIPNDIDAEQVAAVVPTKIVQPKRGDKKQLVALANKNAAVYLEERFALKIRQQERTIGAVAGLGESLGISAPKRIEAFDNSNIMGTAPVSAMVVFIDGKPAKTEYRKYKIKTVIGPDDYASMREVIYRRYSRVLKEKLPLPDLIIIDGGKGQIEAAREVLEDQLGMMIPLAGLAKDDRHRTSELLFGENYEAVVLPRNSEAFYLLQRIQDEVHRFAITFHRQVRSKNSFASKLDEVPGLGPKRKKVLLQKFKSLKRIQEASVDDLRKIGIPVKVAEAVLAKLTENY